MNFSDARQYLHSGKKIRHETMPEGNWIMAYRRGFGYDMHFIVNADGQLSGDDVDFSDLFWSAMYNHDDAWEVAP